MKLESAFLFTVLRPRIERETHVNEGRIERIQRILKPEAVSGCKIAALLQERIKHLLEDVSVPIGVRIG